MSSSWHAELGHDESRRVWRRAGDVQWPWGSSPHDDPTSVVCQPHWSGILASVIALLFSLCTLAAAPEAPDAPAETSSSSRILVMDLGGGALAKDEAGLVGDAIAREISLYLKGEVLSSGDVRRLFDTMGTRQEMDCATDTCLAEIGSALGASRVVHGNVVRLGSRLILELALIEPDRARTLGRASAQAETIEGLYDAIPEAVADLVNKKRRPRRDADRGKGFPLLTATGGTLAATGLLATAAAGATLGVLFSATQEADGDPALKQAFLDHRQNLGIATAVSAGVLVVGGVLLVTGLIVD